MAPTSPAQHLTRRRMIAISAAAGWGLFGGRRAAAGSPLHRWQGQALGARARIDLYHPDRDEARRLIARARDEIARLERVFSLYRADSALSRLNGEGHLDAPPPDLVTLASRARLWSEKTGGAFDVTVQPLWALYQDHFARDRADPAGPPAAAREAAREAVNWRAVEIDSDRLAFARPGMAATFNGIAQGYITDRIADLLRAEGLESVLINLGEIRALGGHPEGRSWRAAIADPADPKHRLGVLELRDRALATSATNGTLFEASGRHHHILDPNQGRASQGRAAASVLATRATDADALSTAVVAAGATPVPLAGLRDLGIERVLVLDAGAAALRDLPVS